MSKTVTNSPQLPKKRLSPELAEVLHMLKALETEPATKTTVSNVR